MRNVIKADLFRVQRKKSYIIMISIVSLLMVGAALLAGSGLFKGDKSENFSMFLSAATAFNSLFIGIPVFSAVLSDDFKSRSMQTAIGMGMSRTKMILARFLEIVFIVVEAYFVFTLITSVLGFAFGIDKIVIAKVVREMWINSIEILVFSAISMIFVYLSQNGSVGMVIYILLSMNIVSLLFNALSLIPFIKNSNIDINDFLASGIMDKVADKKLAAGARAGWAAVLCGCYIALPLFITTRIFRHKELEF